MGAERTGGGASERAAAPTGHRRLRAWSFGVGVVLVAAGGAFLGVGVPALVRLPLSTDQTVHYTGSFTEYVNQQTLAPLARPVTVPMTVARTVEVRSGSFSSAVITEDDTIRPDGLTLHQDFRYLIGRRTMAFEDSPVTSMFGQPAPVRIAGTYRVNFPLGTRASGSYPVWNTETDTATRVSHGRGPTTLRGVSGVRVVVFESTVRAVASPYYRHWLLDNGFPGAITPAQVQARLSALGVDVPALVRTVLPRLTAAQQATVIRALATPVPLVYHYFYTGVVAVEPTTGVLVWVDTTAEGVRVSPSTSALAPLAPILSEYARLPGVPALARALQQLQTPQLAVAYQYVQTPASTRHMAALASSQVHRIDLVQAVPWVVGGLGLVLVAVALVPRRRRPADQPAVVVNPPRAA